MSKYFYFAAMINFTASLKKFENKGEKTGWTYIEIPQDIAEQLKPNCKKSFKVKGKLDAFAIEQVALMPMGDGSFIMAINAAMRKGIAKKEGAMIAVKLQEDKKEYKLDAEFMECLADEPSAYEFFMSKPKSHQRYYSKWIESAKTTPTKTKRIAMAVSSLLKQMDFGEMLRSQKGINKF